MTCWSLPVVFSLPSLISLLSLFLSFTRVRCPDLQSMALEVWENFRHTHRVVQSSCRRKGCSLALFTGNNKLHFDSFSLSPSLSLSLSPPGRSKKKKNSHLTLNMVTRDKKKSPFKWEKSSAPLSAHHSLPKAQASQREIKHSSPSGRVNCPALCSDF